MSIEIKCVILTLISFLVSGCNLISQKKFNSSEPQVVSPQKASNVAKSLPRYTGFSYTGLSFFEGKLYASSNIGLLEYESGKLSHLYKWSSDDDVVEDISFDKANHLLWSFHIGRNKLIRFDGNTWNFVELPKVENGYTRGSILNGFQGFSTEAAFWIQGAKQSWRWNANTNIWVSEPMPKENCYFERNDKNIRCYISIAPIENSAFIIMRRQFVSDFGNDFSTENPVGTNSDIIYFLQDGEWTEFEDNSGIEFFAKKVISGKNCAYILTEQNELLKLTKSKITLIKSLGEVEAIAATSTGNLLVSFSNNGIYEYIDDWQKKFTSPYSHDESKHFTYLAESNGQVAIATTSMRDKNGKNAGQTMLWISDANELKAVPFE
jgi:hypothetical protein